MDGFEWIRDLRFWEGVTVVLAGMTAMIATWKKLRMSHYTTVAWQRTFGRNTVTLVKAINEQQAAIDETRGLLTMMANEIRPNGRGGIQAQLCRIEERIEDFVAITNARIIADHQATFIADKNGKLVAHSRRHQDLTGFNLDQLRGDGWINIVHPDDRDAVMNKWNRAVQEEREFSERLRYVHPVSLRTYNVLVDVFRQLDSTNQLRGYFGVVHPEGEVELMDLKRISR